MLERWSVVSRSQGEEQEASRYQSLSRHFARQAEQEWDGMWYLRGYDDEGKPFGGRGNAECALDSIAQSFAAFAPLGDRERSCQAVTAALEQLWDQERKTIALLTPPFCGLTNPGYIRNYPPGVRENGGQYTHAALWLAGACYRVGKPDKGYALLRDLFPELHDPVCYLAEPYLLAGDVCTALGQEGRGGWSWYTGAAGWFYRVVQEELLGLSLENGVLKLSPRLPETWKQCRMVWRIQGVGLEIELERGTLERILLDDIPANETIDCRQLEGKHHIRVILPETGG